MLMVVLSFNALLWMVRSWSPKTSRFLTMERRIPFTFSCNGAAPGVSFPYLDQNNTTAEKNTANWADLGEIRDQINRAAYLAIPRIPLFPYFLGTAFFVGIIEITRAYFYELVYEFILGAVLLYVSQLVVSRIQNLREPKIDGPLNASVLSDLNTPALGMLQALMDLRAETVREFPIQQNALLVIALIVLPEFDFHNRNSVYGRIILKIIFAACYFALKRWETSRNRATSWRNAARAVREVIRRTSSSHP